MIANLWMAFDDRAQRTANPQEDELPSQAYRALGDPSVRSIFRQDAPAGPRSYELWSLYYELDDQQDVLDVRNDLLIEYPGQLRAIGAWWQDGQQVNGFPLHASILEFIPDIVTYDDDGNETSRTRPTEPSDVNLGMGQIPRIF